MFEVDATGLQNLYFSSFHRSFISSFYIRDFFYLIDAIVLLFLFCEI